MQVAVDQMMTGLLAQGMRVVRVGEYNRTAEPLRHLHVDTLSSQHEGACLCAGVCVHVCLCADNSKVTAIEEALKAEMRSGKLGPPQQRAAVRKAQRKIKKIQVCSAHMCVSVC